MSNYLSLSLWRHTIHVTKLTHLLTEESISLLIGFKDVHKWVSQLGVTTVSTERKFTLAAKPNTQNRGGLEEKLGVRHIDH